MTCVMKLSSIPRLGEREKKKQKSSKMLSKFIILNSLTSNAPYTDSYVVSYKNSLPFIYIFYTLYFGFNSYFSPLVVQFLSCIHRYRIFLFFVLISHWLLGCVMVLSMWCLLLILYIFSKCFFFLILQLNC